MWSLATRLPKRFVMPRSSSFTGSFPPSAGGGPRRGPPPAGRCLPPGAGPLHRALGGRGDLAADDLLLDGLQLGLQAGGDLARPVVERREDGAAIGQRAHVGTAVEGAVRGLEHRGL